MTEKMRTMAGIAAGLLLAMSLAGCGDGAKPDAENSGGKNSGEAVSSAGIAGDANEKKPAVEAQNEEQSAYIDFMKELYKEEDWPRQYLFLDMDGDGKEELLLTERDGGLTVYRYTGAVEEVGRMEGLSGTTVMQPTGDPAHSGLFYQNEGGGKTHCHYLTLKDGKLEDSELWNRDSGAGNDAPVAEISEDEKLIQLSKDAASRDVACVFLSTENL